MIGFSKIQLAHNGAIITDIFLWFASKLVIDQRIVSMMVTLIRIPQCLIWNCHNLENWKIEETWSVKTFKTIFVLMQSTEKKQCQSLVERVKEKTIKTISVVLFN